MQKDLGLTDDGYAWVLSIFFFGYLICEIPSNMILTRSRPSLFLPGIMIVWGVLSALMSLSNNYATMLAFRFILGCIEAGFFPGVLYLLSCWYTSAELGMFHLALHLAAGIRFVSSLSFNADRLPSQENDSPSSTPQLSSPVHLAVSSPVALLPTLTTPTVLPAGDGSSSSKACAPLGSR
jgi:hypothetical protein